MSWHSQIITVYFQSSILVFDFPSQYKTKRDFWTSVGILIEMQIPTWHRTQYWSQSTSTLEFLLLHLHNISSLFSKLHLTQWLILAQFHIIQMQRPFYLEICREQFNLAHIKIQVALVVPLQTSTAELIPLPRQNYNRNVTDQMIFKLVDVVKTYISSFFPLMILRKGRILIEARELLPLSVTA